MPFKEQENQKARGKNEENVIEVKGGNRETVVDFFF